MHVWACLSLTIFIFIRTKKFWLSVSVLIIFTNVRLICSYFLLVTVIIFDLALHTHTYIYIYIYHPHGVFLAGYGWFEGKTLYFNTQIRVYHILFAEETTDYVAVEDFDGIYLILL